MKTIHNLKYITLAIVAAFAVIISACHDKKETQSQGETPEQIDSAVNAGREAARKIIVKEWRDSMQFQNALLEARAAKAEYELGNRQQSTAAFDSAFIATIRATRPDLAAQLQ